MPSKMTPPKDSRSTWYARRPSPDRRKARIASVKQNNSPTSSTSAPIASNSCATCSMASLKVMAGEPTAPPGYLKGTQPLKWSRY